VLSLDCQDRYRERYRTIVPGWHTSGEIYESFVRRALASPQMRLLDVGCGSGGVIEVMSEQVALPVGVDTNLRSLEHHRDPSVRLAVSDLTRLPFADETFGLVVSSWVLEHLAQPVPAFIEIARVLKPFGHFVYVTPNARNVITAINRAVPKLIQSTLVRLLYNRGEKDTFPVAYNANTAEVIDSLAASVGLRAVEVVHVSDPTYLAFGEWLFRLSILIERLTPRRNHVHIVGDYVKA